MSKSYTDNSELFSQFSNSKRPAPGHSDANVKHDGMAEGVMEIEDCEAEMLSCLALTLAKHMTKEERSAALEEYRVICHENGWDYPDELLP